VVPGYEILGELGRGGMGVVYRARQQNLVGRLVALKMLLPDSGAGPEELARFRREAEAVAALRQVNFVHIYDIGEREGRPYFVLEFVDGGSLSQRLAGRPLPPGEAAQLAETLARAMHAAHECGIVHRDLKPTNILLMADGTPKIADFGLAKKLDAVGEQTRTGTVMGSPSYMAPEQALGRTHAIGPATDVYALGTILYEALTGRPPFKAASVFETLNDVVSRPPVPPCRLQPGIPADLESICLRCLQKDPAQRYASAADLAEDLRRVRTGRPLQEGTVVLPPLQTAAHRRRLLGALIGAGVAMLVILGGMVLGWKLWQGPAPSTDLALNQETKKDSTNQEAKKDSKKEEKDQKKGEIKDVQKDPKKEEALWKDLAETKPITIAWGAAQLKCVAFAPDGQTVALAGKNTTVELCDVKTGERRATFEGHPREVYSLAFAPDGKTLAVGTFMQIWLWDVAAPKEPGGILKGHRAEVHWVGFLDAGKSLMSFGSYDPGRDPETSVMMWDVAGKKQTGVLEGPDGRFHTLALSPDGKYLAERAAMPLYDFFKVWDVATKKYVKLAERFVSFAFAPDGKTVVVASGNELRVLEVPSLRERGRYLSHTENVRSVAVSPDGKTLASGSHDKTAILWNVATKVERACLKGHKGPVLVRLSPDGKTLATSSTADGFVKLWDVATGKERATLTDHPKGVADMQFSPKGQTLAVQCRDQSLRIWTLPLLPAMPD
jgi:serine/threonine protein kinase/WD40 repeat protein